MSSDAIDDRGAVESIIKTDMERHRSGEAEEPWGYVDTTARSKLVGKILGKPDPIQLAKDDKHWSTACTHSQPAKGFTCGLWNLFHILTIGASKKDHELYGFHRGFLVSQHHVAETIKNFIAYFFSCDVCRTNFLVSFSPEIAVARPQTSYDEVLPRTAHRTCTMDVVTGTAIVSSRRS